MSLMRFIGSQEKRITPPQGFIIISTTTERIYAVNSLNREASFLKQVHYAQPGKKTQMSLVKNSNFLVLPISTNDQFPNCWELPDIRYRCDYAASTTKERSREYQRRWRIQYVLENIIENNAVEVTRWEVQFSTEIPIKNFVKILLCFSTPHTSQPVRFRMLAPKFPVPQPTSSTLRQRQGTYSSISERRAFKILFAF